MLTHADKMSHLLGDLWYSIFILSPYLLVDSVSGMYQIARPAWKSGTQGSRKRFVDSPIGEMERD